MITKHTCGGPAFGRLTQGCPRCDELRAGASPVRWACRRVETDRRRAAEIAAHDCRKSGCLPICTFGDW